MTPARRQCCRSGVFIVTFELISHSSGVSIDDLEQVNAGQLVDVRKQIATQETEIRDQRRD